MKFKFSTSKKNPLIQDPLIPAFYPPLQTALSNPKPNDPSAQLTLSTARSITPMSTNDLFGWPLGELLVHIPGNKPTTTPEGGQKVDPIGSNTSYKLLTDRISLDGSRPQSDDDDYEDIEDDDQAFEGLEFDESEVDPVIQRQILEEAAAIKATTAGVSQFGKRKASLPSQIKGQKHQCIKDIGPFDPSKFDFSKLMPANDFQSLILGFMSHSSISWDQLRNNVMQLKNSEFLASNTRYMAQLSRQPSPTPSILSVAATGPGSNINLHVIDKELDSRRWNHPKTLNW